MRVSPSRTAVRCLAVVVAACAASIRPAAAQAPDSRPVAGRWAGTYTCAQGQTGVTLTLSAEIMGQVEGLFEFYAVASNPSVPSGRYRMRGWYTVDGLLGLVGTEWIHKPGDYVMVGVLARLAGGGRLLTGTIPECEGAFAAERR